MINLQIFKELFLELQLTGLLVKFVTLIVPIWSENYRPYMYVTEDDVIVEPKPASSLNWTLPLSDHDNLYIIQLSFVWVTYSRRLYVAWNVSI